jgi:hypothetical protein
MRYIVNGGGGAYLSFGTALAWPAQPPLTDWGFYPARAAVFEKVDAQTPWWKRPAWWWTRSLGAWPFSPEWLSAVFDSNVSPFYQSFVKVQVEPAARRVRLLPYGTNGPLTWRDLERSPDLLPVGVDPGAVVEWTVPMAR